MSSTETTSADFWFDPVCPYTWITSRWLVEVTRVRPVSVRWRVMSLQVLNEGLEVNPEDPEGEWTEYLWGPVRVCTAVAEQYGVDMLGRFFTELGVRMHERGQWTAVQDALDVLGMPPALAEFWGDEAYDDAMRASHAEAVALVGPGLGTPVIAFDGPAGRLAGGRAAFFGPVVSPAPVGEAAGRLWDGLLTLAAVPGFRELRSGRLAPLGMEPDSTGPPTR
ncbi:disulfide bond formation protein DsbA [Streptomyces sp. N2-109]|uniref:Disulfide bond formation protein DsbA n=1 Tax=Streptomyces gossypii TaxID=2883101 RepID=A0ABT2K546_9ACTN|nr:disulfide bond formation protein DsbA [Streptomyces gossypii]MCT2594624.1 disulfide bond formation protein DsbA [Streptomyces gossypii]